MFFKRPLPRGASFWNAVGDKSKSFSSQPGHRSTTLTSIDLSSKLAFTFLPQSGLLFGLDPPIFESKSECGRATTISELSLCSPQEPRPG